jgi:integrase
MSVPLKFYLSRRNNGVYYVGQLVNGQRKWKSTGKRTKAEALLVLKQFDAIRSQPLPVATLSQFKIKFLPYVQATFAHRTYLFYRVAMGHFLRIVGDIPLREISAEHVDRFVSERLSQVRAVTVDVELRTIKAAFNVARRWELLEKNPVVGVKRPTIPERPPTFFTKTQFAELMKAIDADWLREIVRFAVLTGLRLGEITHLQWPQVDFDRKVIAVQSSRTFRTKNGKRRVVPMSDSVHELLKAIRARSDTEYVFSIKGKRISESWVTHRFKKAVVKAGITDDLHFHSLRHTFASWLVQDGVSLYEVQKLLGHSSIAVTQVYSHLQPEQLHATVNRLNVP